MDSSGKRARMWRKKGWYPSFFKIPHTSVSLLCHGGTRPPEKPNRTAVNSGPTVCNRPGNTLYSFFELIKAIDDDSKMMAQLTHLCNQIITEGKWPAEFRGSIYVPIYKKGDKMDCKNYRTIALIPHASKIVLGIIHQRMLSYYEQELVRLKQASGKTTEHVTKS